MTLVASFSGRLSDKFDPRVLSSAGMVIIVVGLGMLAFITQNAKNAYLVVCL